MLKFIGFQLKLIFYYLLLFALMRSLFLWDTHKYFVSASFGEIMKCYSSAFKLDVVTSAYFIMPGLIFTTIWYATGWSIMKHINRIFHQILTIIYIGLGISEIYLYREWQAKIGYDSMKHFANISEVLKTPSISMFLGFTIGTATIFLLFRWIYNKWIYTDLGSSTEKRNILFFAKSLLLYLVLSTIFFITMRGGLNRFPIGMGAAYYSNKSALNDAATNVIWHAIYSFLHTSEYDRLHPFLENPKKNQGFLKTYDSPQDTFPRILNTATPNIVFMILESWPADVCLPTGRDSLIAPNFNQLIKDGFYFSDCYAIGHVSDQGIPAILGALPVIPAFSPLTGKQLVGDLPCVVDEFKARNYYTGFLYGGQLDYGNIRGYVYKKGFDKVEDVQNFPTGTKKTALGVPDLPLYEKLLTDLTAARQPFMYCGYNISSHSPYDVPVDYKLGIGGISEPFINTIHYSDSSLNVFFTEAKKQPWFDNTLFILVADHSHESQIVRVKEDKDRYKIPLLLYGPAIKTAYRGVKIESIMSQLDIIGLLYSQLGIPFEKKYPFTRNPLKKNPPEIAFYNFPGGSGVVTKEGFLTKDLNYAGRNTSVLNNPKDEEKFVAWVDKYLYAAAVYLKDM